MLGKAFLSRVSRAVLLLAPAVLLVAFGASATATSIQKDPNAVAVKSSSLGTNSPTFVGPAATGCAAGCQLLTGPFPTASTASAPAAQPAPSALPDTPRALPSPRLPGARRPGAAPNAGATIPTVSCTPLGPGCDTISSSAGGAVGVKGLNAVDSAENTKNIYKDVEPPDQGLCAGPGYAVETNNIGEIKIFNTSLKAVSPAISLDTVMGLGPRGWSSGGDPSCLYDPSNGGHWIFTEIVSASTEANGGAFTGCFAAVANGCYEGIAVTKGSSPFGPYNVYFQNANYNPSEPGFPYQLNDFAKISATRDAFLIFYDEFPLQGNGFGGGVFNGAQQFAFSKTALEDGEPVVESGGTANPAFNVAIENMGTLATPAGTCAKDNTYSEPGVACWYAVIPAQPADSTQWDNNHGGSGFMLGTLDYYGVGGNQLAVWDWTGLDNLSSSHCSACSGIKFGGQLFSGVSSYYNPATGSSSETGYIAPQKNGPTPLADECGAAGLSSDTSCPEGGIETNGDFMTQAAQAQNQLWASTTTEIVQTSSNVSYPNETHAGAVYWVVGTSSFDKSGTFTLTNQSYVSARHEDLEFPTMAAEGGSSVGGNGRAIMSFTLSGNGGPSSADNGGFYPSSAYGRLTSTAAGLTKSVVNIADAGQSPQDGFSEYQGYPGPTRPRWGDYGGAAFLPNSGGKIYFASEYIQYPNCLPPKFTLTIGTCGGTRDGNANWGTSVNYVVP